LGRRIGGKKPGTGDFLYGKRREVLFKGFYTAGGGDKNVSLGIQKQSKWPWPYKEFLMKRTRIFAVALIGILMAVGLILASCKNPTSGGGGCKGDGACYFIRANQHYKWCGDERCNVWSTADVGQATISCNCR
jgi:hypothetical protein